MGAGMSGNAGGEPFPVKRGRVSSVPVSGSGSNVPVMIGGCGGGGAVQVVRPKRSLKMVAMIIHPAMTLPLTVPVIFEVPIRWR